MKNIERLSIQGMIGDFLRYGKQEKARRVRALCWKAGKFKLAKAIALKYGLREDRFDIVTALGYALISLNKRQI
jgi:hypothetical protein